MMEEKSNFKSQPSSKEKQSTFNIMAKEVEDWQKFFLKEWSETRFVAYSGEEYRDRKNVLPLLKKTSSALQDMNMDDALESLTEIRKLGEKAMSRWKGRSGKRQKDQGNQVSDQSSGELSGHKVRSGDSLERLRKANAHSGSPPAAKEVPANTMAAATRDVVQASAKEKVSSDSAGAAKKCAKKCDFSEEKAEGKILNVSSMTLSKEDKMSLKILMKEYQELQDSLLKEFKVKKFASCSEEECQQRKEVLNLTNEVHTSIMSMKVVEAGTGLAKLRKLVKKPASVPGRQEDMGSKRSRQNDQGQEEMEVDDDKAQSNSSSDSFEVISKADDQYMSEDEDDLSPKGATGKQNSGAATASVSDPGPDECPICLEVITDKRVLENCKHIFCRKCIDEAFSRCGPKCPLCNTMYGKMMGTQPKSGHMRVEINQSRLPGYPHHGTIVIHYHFPNGTQEADHPNPGRPYSGTTRTAYLPDNPNGKKVMKLLRQAFEARLVFTVGTSVTTGRSDTVVWNNIHHKTSMHGGPQGFGYPDPKYLCRVLEELAAFGIK